MAIHFAGQVYNFSLFAADPSRLRFFLSQDRCRSCCSERPQGNFLAGWITLHHVNDRQRIRSRSRGISVAVASRIWTSTGMTVFDLFQVEKAAQGPLSANTVWR